MKNPLVAVLTLLLIPAPLVRAQGNLTPPGAPAATMKTLDQLDTHVGVAGEQRIDVLSLPGNGTNQYIISAPGSYYLSGRIVGVSGKNGINIQAGNVFLDLNGYEVAGVSGALSGIFASGTHRDIVVRNGTLASWPGAGLDLSNAEGMVVTDIVSSLNGTSGIITGDGGVVLRCCARENTGDNLIIGNNSTVGHCVAVGSTGGNGMTTGRSCSVTECSASENSLAGMVTGPNCTVGQVVANLNTGHGIVLGFFNVATMCIANFNSLNGFEATDRAHLFRCTAYANQQTGIHAKFAPLVNGCYSESNGIDGILVDAGGVATISENSCLENGPGSVHGAGIRVTIAAGSRIERNCVSYNYYGIFLGVVGNIVTANTATGNTVNFNFVAGNHYGPIVDDTAVDPGSAPAVNGSSAAGDVNTTTSLANFSY